jgi:hypothetical protein
MWIVLAATEQTQPTPKTKGLESLAALLLIVAKLLLLSLENAPATLVAPAMSIVLAVTEQLQPTPKTKGLESLAALLLIVAKP